MSGIARTARVPDTSIIGRGLVDDHVHMEFADILP